MRFRITLLLVALLPISAWFQLREIIRAEATVPETLPGLLSTVEVTWDSEGIPHIYAENDHDAVFMLGWAQAKDRLFQMDFGRRQASGTLAELLGPSALNSDIQFRTLGVRRAAEESWDVLSPRAQEMFQAFADGINAYLNDPGHTLPPEYGALELSKVEPWTALDGLTIAKSAAFALSFDLDIDLTLALDAFQEAGATLGFDGTALFFEDLFRSAPFDPAVSIPSFTANRSVSALKPGSRAIPRVGEVLRPGTLELARQFRERLRDIPALDRAAQTDRQGEGSNWWVVAGAHTASGHPLLANDPHLALNTPPTFYEAHLVVSNDPIYGPMNVNGVVFPGTPSVAQGCNERICWGSTVNPLDVTDIFEEELIVSLLERRPTHTVFEGKPEQLVAIDQTYRVNQIGNGHSDDFETAPVGPTEGGVTYLVPRRNMGPLIAVSAASIPFTGLSVQYAGARATREPDALLRWTRAASLAAFREGLQYFDVGSQNWAYADVDGNIAYFTSAELPLREDLESGQVDGLPPFFIRSGNHSFKNEWIPMQSPPQTQSLHFEILPFEEMPQIVNPASGYIISANNDPVGLTLDNKPLNTTRPSGGLYYLSPGYASIRMGRIAQLTEEAVGVGMMDLGTLKAMQSDNRMLDAEVLLPYLLAAFENAGQTEASAPLAALAVNEQVAEAVNRLSEWDFSTPTGIAGGFDPGDDPDQLPAPSQQEAAHSVAATIYSVWRGQLIRGTIQDTLEKLGLEAFQPDSERSMSAVRNLLDNFDSRQGIGVSGLNFFQADGLASSAEARDFILLRSLQSALGELAGSAFAPAYSNSTDQEDYRWGKLHRIVFDHPLGEPFNVPDAGSFQNLSAELPGLARAGGFEVVDASGHSARANSVQAFTFGAGPSRRLVAELDPDGIRAFQVIPGGQSGIPGSSHQVDQLGRWLTNDFHPLRLSRADVAAATQATRLFQPGEYRFFFPVYRGDASTFTGFAVSNLSESSLDLEWKAYDGNGALLPFDGNPRSMELTPRAQIALLGSDIFQTPGTESQSGWVDLSATPLGPVPTQGPPLGSFTQFGSFDLSRLDGGVAVTKPSRQLVFTRVFEGEAAFRGRPATTVLSLANPYTTPTDLRLRLVRWRDNLPGPSDTSLEETTSDLTRTMTLPPSSVLTAPVSEIFQSEISTSDAYVEARTLRGFGATGFELVWIDNARTVLGLNAAQPAGQDQLYSAQMASTDVIFTNLRLINLADTERQIHLTPVGNNGENLADPVDLRLPSGASIQKDLGELFGLASQEGSLILEADGPGLAGDVTFGDQEKAEFAAALPLQLTKFSRAVFSQVGNTASLFTGLAFYNPHPQDVRVIIRVYSQSGSVVGETTVQLGPGHRVSRLLHQAVPESEGQQGGYILVQAEKPIIGQQLFGTYRLSLLSAVPPAIVE